MIRQRTPVCVIIGLAIALLVSCGSDGPLFVPITEDFSHIEDPSERWRAYNLQNYTISQMRSCFCGPPYSWTAIIRGGEVVDVVVMDKEGDSKELHAKAMQMAWTVEEAFELIREAAEGADNYEVQYHSRFGYPVEFSVDWNSGLADDELRQELTDLRKFAR